MFKSNAIFPNLYPGVSSFFNLISGGRSGVEITTGISVLPVSPLARVAKNRINVNLMDLSQKCKIVKNREHVNSVKKIVALSNPVFTMFTA